MPKEKQAEETAPNPREKLGEYYNLEEELPQTIKEKINKPQTASRKERPGTSNAVTDIFEHTGLTLVDKEKIAISILNGTYTSDMMSPAKSAPKLNSDHLAMPRRASTKDTESRTTLNRHNQPKPQFLNITTQAADIPELNPKAVYSAKIDLIRNTPQRVMPIIARSSSKVALPQDLGLDSDRNRRKHAAAQAYKIKSALQLREELERKQQEANDVMQSSKEMKDTVKRVKGKIDKFRKDIKTSLMSRDDIKVGAIMKAMTDELLHAFLLEYKGYDMSINALLGYIGEFVTDHIAQPDPEINPELLNSDFGTRLPNGKYSKADIKLEALSPSDNSIERHTLNTNKLHDTSLYFPARRHSFDKGRVPTDSVRGSGFHLNPEGSKASQLFHEAFHDTNSVHSLHSTKWPERNDELGRSISGMVRKKAEDKKKVMNPKYSYDWHMDNTSNWESQNDLMETISVMNKQLILENILPSLQPERVLSHQNITALGLHEKTFEDIMKDIEQGRKTASLPLFLTHNTDELRTSFGPIVSPGDSMFNDDTTDEAGAGGVGEVGHNDRVTGRGDDTERDFDRGNGRGNSREDVRKRPMKSKSMRIRDTPKLENYPDDDDDALAQALDSLSGREYGLEEASEISMISVDVQRRSHTPVGGESGGSRGGGGGGRVSGRVGSGGGGSGRLPESNPQNSKPCSGSNKRFHMQGAMSWNYSEGAWEALRGVPDSVPPSPKQSERPGGYSSQHQSGVAPHHVTLGSGLGVRSSRNIKSRGGPQDGPKMPYASQEQAENVWNSGVAAGAGYTIMRPKHRITKEGRFRVGIASPIKNERDYDPLAGSKYHKKIFMSMA